MLASFVGWFNREKLAFSASALWLLAMGLGFQAVPKTKEWGPPMTQTPPPEEQFVNLAPPPPLAGFISGERANPFGEREMLTAYRPGALWSWRPPGSGGRTTRPPRPGPTRPPPPPPRPPKPSTIRPGTGGGNGNGGGPKAYDLPVEAIGRIQVGSSARWVIFKVKEDGRTIRVREGMQLPGLGVKLVRATKNVIIVENEKGQRFRLTDLMREKQE